MIITTNLPPILHRFQDIAFDRSKIAIFGYRSCVQLLRRKGSLHHVIVSYMSLKLDNLGYISVAESLGMSSTTFTQCALEATEFGEITQIRAIMLFKVTDFGASRNLIYDCLLVININLPPILNRFRDMAFDRFKIGIFGYRSCV